MTQKLLLGLALLLSSIAGAATRVAPALHDQALAILQKSVSFRTVQGAGQVPAYAEYLKSVLVDAGFPAADIQIEPIGETAILTARYRGTASARKPIVLLGHMDVVEARREDWKRDPFTPVVENGYVFGRGSLDNKFEVSIMVATLANLRRAGWKPGRDVILALSGDEETEMVTTRELAKRLAGAEFALNGDAGGGLLGDTDSPVFYGIQAGEKTYADFTLTVTNPGGHSSRPGKKNAINQLARALDRIAAYEFPVLRNELTEAYFRSSAPNTPGPIGEAMKRYAANPADSEAISTLTAEAEYVGQLRTTCVATQLAGGHAQNALPQKATANVNCRIFPGTPVEDVRKTLIEVAADPEVGITQLEMGSIESPTSPLRPDVMKAVTKSVHAQYPTLSIVPSMSAGATDSMHFRAQGVPSYGVSGLFMKAADDYAHGLDERVPVAGIDGALAHWDSILRDLAK